MKRTILSAAVVVLMWGVMSGAAGLKDLEKAIAAKDEAKAGAILKENPGLVNLPKERDEEDRRYAPLVRAVQSGNTGMVELLIKNGADVNALDWRGNTALYHGMENFPEDMKLAEALLKAGADPNKGVYPPLLGAVQNQHKELAKLLRKNGAKLDVVGKSGVTVLDMAALAGDLEMAKEAIAAGIDVNKESAGGVTPICGAAADGRIEMVKFLIQKGAKVDVKSDRGTLLFWALSGNSENMLEMVELLITHKVDVHRETRFGSAMTEAAEKANLKVLQAVMKAGGDVNAPAGEARKTPLMAAARASRPENVKYLLLKGADAAKTDKEGKTALDYAIKGAGKNAKTDETVKVLEEEAAKRKQKGG